MKYIILFIIIINIYVSEQQKMINEISNKRYNFVCVSCGLISNLIGKPIKVWTARKILLLRNHKKYDLSRCRLYIKRKYIQHQHVRLNAGRNKISILYSYFICYIWRYIYIRLLVYKYRIISTQFSLYVFRFFFREQNSLAWNILQGKPSNSHFYASVKKWKNIGKVSIFIFYISNSMNNTFYHFKMRIWWWYFASFYAFG